MSVGRFVDRCFFVEAEEAVVRVSLRLVLMLDKEDLVMLYEFRFFAEINH